MPIKQLHRWDVNIEQAKSIQLALQQRIVLSTLPKPINLIAGADVSSAKNSNRLFAAISLCHYPDLSEVETAVAEGTAHFPYIPGYLTFREAPLLLKALEQLRTLPDVLICDGQGIAHPRKLGIATHLGIILDIPTIGCAKSKLIGDYENLPRERGAHVPLVWNEQQIGAVVRSRTDVKPVFVSPGFKITCSEAINIVLASCTHFRLPEPIRRAHFLVNDMRRLLSFM